MTKLLTDSETFITLYTIAKTIKNEMIENNTNIQELQKEYFKFKRDSKGYEDSLLFKVFNNSYNILCKEYDLTFDLEQIGGIYSNDDLEQYVFEELSFLGE